MTPNDPKARGAAITVSEHVYIPASALTITASRASGPGGQNVNKVASKVDVRLDLGAIVGLDEAQRARLLRKAEPRLDGEGKLQVISQKTRDQAKNIADAYEKIAELVRAALIAPKVRRPTRPSRGAVERRIEEKKRTAVRKQNRGRGGED